MATNKNKQNLRVQKVCERIHKKVRYDGLTPDEVKLIKASKQHEQVEKDLNNFWVKVPRLENGIVNWDAMSEDQLDYFEYINKQFEKLSKKISKLEDKGIDIDKVMNIFMQLNCNSVSF